MKYKRDGNFPSVDYYNIGYVWQSDIYQYVEVEANPGSAYKFDVKEFEWNREYEKKTGER